MQGRPGLATTATPFPRRKGTKASCRCTERHLSPGLWGFNSDEATGGDQDGVHRVMLLHIDGEEVSTTDGGKANLHEANAVGELLERIAPQCVEQRLSVLVTTPLRHTQILI